VLKPSEKWRKCREKWARRWFVHEVSETNKKKKWALGPMFG